MALNTTIGNPARGDEYFARPALTGKLWQKVRTGSGILVAAPRRVGKSSILFHFYDNPPENFRLIYLDTESVNNENEFFKRLFNHVVNNLTKVKKYSKIISNVTKSLTARIESIGAKGISFGDSRLNYYDEFISLVKSLNMGEDRLVIMLDEYAETVQNIRRDEGEGNAVRFLQSTRSLRMMPEMAEKIQFILAGSIGLENIVENLAAPGTINDLYSFRIPPFSRAEAKALIAKIIEDSGYVFEERKMDYMLDKIEWLIPFYIQLIVDEIDKLDFPGEPKKITEKEIDEAFLKAIEHRNYFDNWHTRLRRNYSGAEYNFAKKLLNYISDEDTIKTDELVDLATACGLEEGFVNILNALKYDGYINNNENSKVYRFNSPLLKIWWNKNVAF